MINYQRTVGIDISKDKFDVFIIRSMDGSKVTEKSISFQFNTKGLEEFIKMLEPQDLCIMEATGCYHERLVRVLHEQNIAQAIINPRNSHHYTKMMGSITKTDSQDAMRLAHFGRQYGEHLPLFKMPQAEELQTKALYKDLRIFKKALQTAKNQLRNRHLSLLNAHVKHLTKLVDDLQAQVDELETQLAGLMKVQYEEDYNLLIKIPGLGKVCVSAFLMAYHGFIRSTTQPNVKAFAKHLGLAPTITQSGKRKAKSRLGRSADPTLVAALFLGTKSAITTTKKDNPIKSFANRLRERAFPFNKACIAAVHKVVRIAWAVLSTRQPYQPDYTPIKPQTLNPMLTPTQNLPHPNKISSTA